jgi:Transmembrane secretion effector
MHWPEPALAGEVDPDRGPVLIEITYRVKAENKSAFLVALKTFSRERRRDGGYRWQVFEDAEDPTRIIEIFFVPSWLDHLRQHQRVTGEDADLQTKVAALHEGPDPPKVRHLLAG